MTVSGTCSDFTVEMPLTRSQLELETDTASGTLLVALGVRLGLPARGLSLLAELQVEELR